MNQLFDDNTMNFIDLWSYIQDRSWFEDAISPEDMVLINELVSGSNFEIALDMLRHRLHPFRKKIPEEFAEVLKPAKCIKVRDTSHMDGFVNRRPPLPSRRGKEQPRLVDSKRGNGVSRKETGPKKETVDSRKETGTFKKKLETSSWKVEELPEIYENARRRDPVPVALTDTDVSELIMEEERWERKTLRETQDEEYQQSLAADKKRAAGMFLDPDPSDHCFVDNVALSNLVHSPNVSTLDSPDKWPDSLFTVFPTDATTFPVANTEAGSFIIQEKVVDEPKSDDSGVISVVVVLPSGGTRVSRFFLGHHTLENVATWVKVAHGVTLSCFSTTFPRQSWSLDTCLELVSQGQKRLLIFGEE